MAASGEVVCIFTSTRTLDHEQQYDTWAQSMDGLVRSTPGYLRHVSVRDDQSQRGVTISYFNSHEAVEQWRQHAEHQRAQQLGREQFYEEYSIDIATVDRSYRWSAS